MKHILVTLEAVHEGKVLDWTWKRIAIGQTWSTMDQIQIGKLVKDAVSDMRLRGWVASGKAGVRLQIVLDEQTD